MSSFSHTPLGPGAEFDRIRRALARLGSKAIGAGDDCAFVEVGAERLALSCDLTIEGTHFRAGWLAPVELGWRATAAALSDLAAVAARPLGVLTSVAVPAEWPEEHFADLMEGVGQAAKAAGAAVWGGDLVRAERVVVDVMVAGRLEGEPVRRSGARPGALCASGAPRAGGPLAQGPGSARDDRPERRPGGRRRASRRGFGCGRGDRPRSRAAASRGGSGGGGPGRWGGIRAVGRVASGRRRLGGAGLSRGIRPAVDAGRRGGAGCRRAGATPERARQRAAAVRALPVAKDM